LRPWRTFFAHFAVKVFLTTARQNRHSCALIIPCGRACPSSHPLREIGQTPNHSESGEVLAQQLIFSEDWKRDRQLSYPKLETPPSTPVPRAAPLRLPTATPARPPTPQAQGSTLRLSSPGRVCHEYSAPEPSLKPAPHAARGLPPSSTEPSGPVLSAPPSRSGSPAGAA
jgi:hypothetical protein